MPSPSVTAVVFDLDGTVWDSAPGIVGSMEATLADLDLPHPGDAVLAAALGPPLMELLVEIGVPNDRLDEARDTYRRHYRARGEAMCVPYPHMPELLDDLRAAGIATATATSKGVEVAHRMLDRYDLRRRFDVVAAASMTQAGHDKVAVVAEALDGLAERNAVATDERRAALDGLTAHDGTGPHGESLSPLGVWMIGDRRFDIDAGRHHGLRTVAVTWGYAPPGELDAAHPDHTVDDVESLAALLLPGGH